MQILKELTLTLELDTETKKLSVVTLDPWSGTTLQADFAYNPEKHRSFNEWIGNEVYGWLGAWAAKEEKEELPEVCDACSVVDDDVATEAPQAYIPVPPERYDEVMYTF